MFEKKYLITVITILFCCILQQKIHAQCTTPIAGFPYDENFEANDGNWVRSSPDHWEWGQIISKPVITAAGGGSKCWFVGGASGSFYNSGTSYLQSPCFDISSLSYPEISFKIFWETERRYDGVLLQYSTDAGINWFTLGTINSNSNCEGVNWYNYDPVNFLGGPGWSGNIQATSGSCVGGGGSAGWLTARHSLTAMAGASTVIFRFAFAAGLTCNNFDGFAVDDIHIGEAPSNSADFTYSCSGNNSATFISSAVGCKTSVSWLFDDVASGANNTSVLDNPTHIFSAPGDYTISLTTNFTTGPSVTVAKTIHIIEATGSVTNAIKCFGDKSGAITVTVNPTGTYDYAWDTDPVLITPSISNLDPRTYTVTITGTNVCAIALPVSVTSPEKLNLVATVNEAACGFNNGSITTVVTGGTAPIDYLWSNSAVTTSINDLAPGVYQLFLKDANGCTVNSDNIFVNNRVNDVAVSLGPDRSICPGQSVVLKPGNFAAYQWQDNSTSATYTVNAPGTYSVMVTDNAGCKGFSTVKIDECADIYFPSAFTPNGDPVNDKFGPSGNNLAAINNYKLIVYGRWGEVVFSSTDPYKKWDGTYKGKPQGTGTFVWIATYSINNLLPITQKGTLTLFR